MATVHVGSVWNLQNCLRSSIPITCMSQNFYPGDLRSGQFRDLPIISRGWKMKLLPVSHKLTETIQFYLDHGHSPHLWWPGCNWRSSGVTGRSPEVRLGHNQFFTNKSRQDGDRYAQMVPNDLARWTSSDDVHIDLLGSWSDLDLTWPEVKFWNWPFLVKKYTGRTGSTRPTWWCHFYFCITHIKRLIQNHLREKR